MSYSGCNLKPLLTIDCKHKSSEYNTKVISLKHPSLNNSLSYSPVWVLSFYSPLGWLVLCFNSCDVWHRGDRSDSIIWWDRGWHLPPHPRHWIGRYDWRSNTSASWRCVGSFKNCIDCLIVVVQVKELLFYCIMEGLEGHTEIFS